MKLKIVDITFRDRGYRNNFVFDEDIILKTISALNDSGVDFIEVGYKNYTLKNKLSIRTTPLHDNFLAKLTSFIPDRACVMIHPHNINIQDIKTLHSAEVKMVRVNIPSPDIQEAIKVIYELKSFDFLVMAHVTRITQITEKDLELTIQQLDQSEADVIYIADSNGAIIKGKTKSVKI